MHVFHLQQTVTGNMREEKRRRSSESSRRDRILCAFLSVFAVVNWVNVVPAAAAAKDFDYKDALSKSLLYFESQRSGRLPYTQRVTWRGHSGLTDGLQQGVDLVGGYYDAGDHVKFGLPMAFTITMLSWSVIEYGDEVAAAGEYGHALEAIKWGTDYFIKAHTHPDVLWAEVGDGDTDHYCWQRPEDMTTSRQAYKIDRENPGSDVAGETAAAMAAASIVFRKSNPHYSHLLLHHAQQLFEFGDKYRGKYDSSISEAKSYYPSWSGYEDELLWAALWLHRATGKREYVDYVVDNGEAFGGTGWAVTEFSWDVKYAGVQILASKLLKTEANLSARQRSELEKYESKAEYYVCACLNKNAVGGNLQRSPGGMLFVRQWNNMQYVSTAAFLLMVYSDRLEESGAGLRCPGGGVERRELVALAKSQADYVLGSNPMRTSYLVGHGRRFPKRVHHRAASVVSYKRSKGFIGCMQGYYDWYGRREANPNVVVGAIVGGPDGLDRFRDQRGNYMQTEACTYNTAPMVGVFAKLHRLSSSSSQRRSPQRIQEASATSTAAFSS
ncbi:endoglucanase 7-like [Canna indica]|uniref:Endoglucanase n=1 Tax=Canna indica TaxID=4628 RepID=A0AAQ3KDA9_9LILI|nr:endoglucanase 7-like [Canna indica]